MGSYQTGSAPHIRASQSVPGIYWQMVFALMPAGIAALIFFGWHAVSVLGCAVSAAMLAECLAKKLFQKPIALHDGSSVFFGLLFGMLCAPGMPAWMIALGSFAALFVGKELFGGTGQYVFHPVLVGQAFLQVCFVGPSRVWAQREMAVNAFSIQELLIGWGPGMLGETSALAILIGGIYLIVRKILLWEMPLVYLGVLGTGAAVLGMNPWHALLSGSAFMAAFFVVCETTTTPMTRAGLRWFVFGCAILLLVLKKWSGFYYALSFSVLLMNALTPWIDARIRPPKSGLAKAAG